MKIKEEKRIGFFVYLNNILRIFYKIIYNKRVQIILITLFILSIFIMGNFSGLLVSGFFGTLNNPSQKTIDLLHFLGIFGLRDFKYAMESVLKENIKIPFNYIKGQFSNPEKIYIDIAFEDYQKIEYKRNQALNSGYLISSAEDYVSAKIRYNGEEIKVDLRLKGDLIDHLEGDKWSFRIKVKGDDALFGMKSLSIQDPKTRSYVSESIYHETLKKEDVPFLRYDFIEVIVNGENKGIYAIEEHFDKELIENNNRREGVIIKFNEDLRWKEISDISNYLSEAEFYNYIEIKGNEWFYESNIECFKNKTISKDQTLSKQCDKGKNLLEYFRQGELKTREVFDVDILAKYFAINTVLGSAHSSLWNNIRFYYNPVTSHLEPIGYDAHSEGQACEILEFYKAEPFNRLIFEDDVFLEKYNQELMKMSQKDYLDNLFLELENEIKKDVKYIHKDVPYYHFSTDVFYNNQNYLREILSEGNMIDYFKENNFMKGSFLETDFIRQEFNLSFDFLIIDENSRTINIQQGSWILEESLIIPEGYKVYSKEGTTIDLTNGATILSYSGLQLIGTKNNPIKIISSDGTGQGLSVFNVEEKSNLKYVSFDGLSTPLKSNWELTGAVTFYESPASLDNVVFLNMKSEDSLNIIRSEFEIKNSVFENSFSDCLDVDFGNGKIISTTFNNCGNDGLDISGSVVELKDLKIINVGDKGMSIGEESEVYAENIEINKGYIGVASKDQSNLEIKNIKISECEYDFALYQKKPEFGPASINAIEVEDESKYIVEKESKLSVNEKIILSGEEKVYDKLYGEEK